MSGCELDVGDTEYTPCGDDVAGVHEYTPEQVAYFMYDGPSPACARHLLMLERDAEKREAVQG